MTPNVDDSLERLRSAVRQIAISDVDQVLNEARTEARARVRAMLTDAIARSLLDEVERRGALSPGEPEIASEPPQQADGDAADALYVYGVIAEVPLAADGPRGAIGGRPIRLVAADGLAAIVTDVPFEQFDDEQLRSNLADMNWVEAVARTHEAALEWARSQTTVIPMRICTVYRAEERVREMLRRERQSFRDTLEHLENRAEWGVKVFADAPPPDQSAEVAPSGTAYLDHRRENLKRRERADAEIAEAAAQIHERLSAVAVDGLTAPPQRPEASGHAGQMVLNGVYLVDDRGQDEFERLVSELQSEFGRLDLTLVQTGPWPAYNFVSDAIGAAW